MDDLGQRLIGTVDEPVRPDPTLLVDVQGEPVAARDKAIVGAGKLQHLQGDTPIDLAHLGTKPLQQPSHDPRWRRMDDRRRGQLIDDVGIQPARWPPCRLDDAKAGDVHVSREDGDARPFRFGEIQQTVQQPQLLGAMIVSVPLIVQVVFDVLPPGQNVERLLGEGQVRMDHQQVAQPVGGVERRKDNIPARWRQDLALRPLRAQVEDEQPELAEAEQGVETNLSGKRRPGRGLRIRMQLEQQEAATRCPEHRLQHVRRLLLVTIGTPAVEDVVVVPHHQRRDRRPVPRRARRAGSRRSRPGPRMEMREVPHRWRRKPQMRIVGEERLAARAALARNGPAVGRARRPARSRQHVDAFVQAADVADRERLVAGIGSEELPDALKRQRAREMQAQQLAAPVAARSSAITLVHTTESIRNSLAVVGNKIFARQTVTKLGVPVVPALENPSHEPSILREQAHALGYPLLIKAASGGGGKGMRSSATKKILRRQSPLLNVRHSRHLPMGLFIWNAILSALVTSKYKS